MLSDAIEAWHRSGRPATISGKLLRTVSNSKYPDMPVVLQRGQAETVFVRDESGGDWILKKFHSGRCPDLSYLESVRIVLPGHPGLRAGNERIMLSDGDLEETWGCFRSRELREYINDAVLMPRVPGIDWIGLADDIRDGAKQLDEDQRVTLCQNLCELIQVLENSRCAHRDLSCGNVFVEPSTLSVSLIDLDSLFHPSLTIPEATTGGTDGYLAPFVWGNGGCDPSMTWCERADRYALSLLIVEFLIMDESTPLVGDGGVFDQNELRRRSGKTIRYATDRLRELAPDAVTFFGQAIRAQSFDDCPSPAAWQSACSHARPTLVTLDSLECVEASEFTSLLDRRISYPAGVKSELETIVVLPDDPWEI